MKTFFKIASFIVSIILISCSDNEEMWIKTELPEDTDVSLLDIWSYEVPFQVQSNGEWKIETDGDWFYVFPKSGKGNATVQICVLENDTEERQTGTITLSTINSSTVQTLKIGQKCVSDYNLTSIEDEKTTKNYAVGYGYDTRGAYASPDDVMKQIVRWKEMDAEDLIAFNAPSSSFYERTVTGSSLEELSQNLSASLKFKGKYCGFKGEVKSAFQGSITDNEYNEYAISYIDYKVTDIILDTDIEEIKENWLTDAARKAINGERDAYKGTEGVLKLFREYGTHLITKADLGGRLRYNLTIDVSNVTGYYDITAYMKVSHSNIFSSTQVTIDSEIKKSFQENNASRTLSFKASGGNSTLLTVTSDNEAIENWKKSVGENYNKMKENKTALIGFGENLEGLIPLYELADNATRKEEIKNVMESKGFVEVEYEDKNTYYVEVPSFEDKISTTLVKEVKDENNRVVAIVCNEFIPEISPSKRVDVVYPVASGRILMHAGFFTGYQGRRPARISWNGSSLKIVDCDTLQENSYRNLYVSGATVLIKPNKEYKKTVCQDTYLKANNYNYYQKGDYEYPLVKIFGNIWTREAFVPYRKADGSLITGVFTVTENEHTISNATSACTFKPYAMYNLSVATSNNFAPSGWEVPSSTHYKDIDAMLTKYNLHTGQSFRCYDNKGNRHPQTLGYEAISDWMIALRTEANDKTAIQYRRGKVLDNRYWTMDGWMVTISEVGFSVVKPDNLSKHCYLPVRLIKKN